MIVCQTSRIVLLLSKVIGLIYNWIITIFHLSGLKQTCLPKQRSNKSTIDTSVTPRAFKTRGKFDHQTHLVVDIQFNCNNLIFILFGRTIPNSITKCNVLVDMTKHCMQRETDVNRSSELYKLNGNDCDKVVDSLSPMVGFFVNESGYRVFKTLTPLSRNEFETVEE